MIQAVPMELDDNVILATDDAGEDLFRFELNWNGAKVHIRYPTYGQWDGYCRDVTMILRALGSGPDDIDIPEDGTKPALWAELKSWILLTSKLKQRIEDVFFTYLKPELPLDDKDPIVGEELKHWLGANAPIDAVVRMFCVLMTPQDMLKKNAIYHLTRIYPHLMGQLFKPTVTKSGDGTKEKSEDKAYSNSTSF